MDAALFYLGGNADAVEFCPHEPYTNLLAASTYTLQEGDHPSRSGSVSLFNVGNGEDVCLDLVHRTETAGVFDIRWSRGCIGCVGTGLALALADAHGCLRVYGLEEGEERGFTLREVSADKISSSYMCLCLDWDPSSTSISVGLSDGSVSVVSFTDSKLETLQEWKAHDFELWATSFDLQNPHLIFTGSDDCKFSCWDFRICPANAVFHNSKVHTMGVCCIAPSPSDPNSIFTGSYDEQLRVWDVRSVSRPVNEISVCLGGGIWRIKHHPSVPGVVLAACMHNGFAIVKVGHGKAEVMETYNKHLSLAYGADWQRGKGHQKHNVAATCSFYDQLLRVWKPQTDICRLIH